MSYETYTATLDGGGTVTFDAYDTTSEDEEPEVTWFDIYTTVLGG
jgi:hypothetical protein